MVNEKKKKRKRKKKKVGKYDAPYSGAGSLKPSHQGLFAATLKK